MLQVQMHIAKAASLALPSTWVRRPCLSYSGQPLNNVTLLHLVLGTYSGIDRTKGFQADSSSHVIVVYQPALESLCGSDKERLEHEIHRVVLHELAHHLEMSHHRMKEIGL
jgi:predicted Zn-dependent protease with MMP-like domain